MRDVPLDIPFEVPFKVPFEEINTLHGLLHVAIGDLEKVLDDKRYIVNMNVFHTPTFMSYPPYSEMKCSVCLAGAVMAKSLDFPINRTSSPARCENQALTNRLRALDALRKGDVIAACAHMDDTEAGVKWMMRFQSDRFPIPRLYQNAYRNDRVTILIGFLRNLETLLAEMEI